MSYQPKHMRGPWTIDASGTYLLIRCNLSDRKHMAHEEIVAQTYNLNDAALISAAPDMHDALIALLDGIAGPANELAQAVELARKALAKAQGGTV